MPRATLILDDMPDGTINLMMSYDGAFNDESRAHVTATLLERHMSVICEVKSDPTQVQLAEKNGRLEVVREDTAAILKAQAKRERKRDRLIWLSDSDIGPEAA